jgi:hypothetical protein
LSKAEREHSARRERAQTVALWRYALVAPAMDEALTGRERGQLVRELAGREHPGPFGGRVRVSRKSLDRWVRTRRRGGFDALIPAPRRVQARTDATVLATAVSLKKENPRRTAAQVRRILVELSPQGWAPSERTLQRHFAALELNTRPDGQPPKAYGRFEAEKINEIWTADTLHGPKIAGRKAYVHGIIDDHSRRLVDHQCVYHDDAARFLILFRHAIAHRGIPSTLYVDNGAPFVDEALLRTCARLGIRVDNVGRRLASRGPASTGRQVRTRHAYALKACSSTTPADAGCKEPGRTRGPITVADSRRSTRWPTQSSIHSTSTCENPTSSPPSTTGWPTSSHPTGSRPHSRHSNACRKTTPSPTTPCAKRWPITTASSPDTAPRWKPAPTRP